MRGLGQPDMAGEIVGALILARAVDDPKLSDALRKAALERLVPGAA
jgi:hypothetical protein